MPSTNKCLTKDEISHCKCDDNPLGAKEISYCKCDNNPLGAKEISYCKCNDKQTYKLQHFIRKHRGSPKIKHHHKHH